MNLSSCITYECIDVVYEIFFGMRIVSRGCVYTLRDAALRLNLPFDMCRWLVEGKDVEVVHEVLAKHHQYLTSRPLLRL